MLEEAYHIKWREKFEHLYTRIWKIIWKQVNHDAFIPGGWERFGEFLVLCIVRLVLTLRSRA